eukprot:61518-Amphidinium_carterae.1
MGYGRTESLLRPMVAGCSEYDLLMQVAERLEKVADALEGKYTPGSRRVRQQLHPNGKELLSQQST